MILPDAKVKEEKGTIKKVINYMAFWKTESDDPHAINVPTPLIMRSKCMEIHLQPTKTLLLSGEFDKKFTIQDGIDGILKLLDNVIVQWFENRGRAEKWTVDGLESVSVLIKFPAYNFFNFST